MSPRQNPNVLLVTFDQWRADAVGHLGAPVVRTPTADRLAARGVSFARHFVQATPCGPSRACLWTGLHQMTNRVVRNGAPLDQRFDNLAAAMRRIGYEPALFGHADQVPEPWETDPTRRRRWQGELNGFTEVLERADDPTGWLDWLAARGIPKPNEPWQIFLPKGEAPPRPAPLEPQFNRHQTESAYMADAFLDWAAGEPADRPFFAHLSFFAPHPHWIVPDPFRTMYDPADGPAFKRAATAAADAAVHPVVANHMRKTLGSDFACGSESIPASRWSEADFRQARATYWGMVTEVDAQLGRLLDGLDALGRSDTLVILTSDHGEQLGDRHTLGKFGFYDESYHVPLIIADPRRPAGHGTVVKDFTATIDLFPTLLDCLGGQAKHPLDGRTLLPWLNGERPADVRDAVYWEADYRDAAAALGGPLDIHPDHANLAVARTHRYKYVGHADLPPLLFDLETDPQELRNLADHPAYTAVRLAMAERLAAWRARHLDRRLTGILINDRAIIDDRAR
ncbi:sulfatase-like hydrolase/transferase [Oryzibacter oryziterrae]|uniref:sulfatase-like hydrolase/transferase n=1 Tax=Oryzibacter oryziterrae TaxID=2766474 RepID=UPI001F007E9A|nr:sulfatase-like hydrolase/transferase [Oryzibacter oryziterrae]